MLTNKKISITAKTMIDDNEIAGYGAVINTENENDVSFFHKQVDKYACKLHRDDVRADQAEFEDLAYQIEEVVRQLLNN